MNFRAMHGGLALRLMLRLLRWTQRTTICHHGGHPALSVVKFTQDKTETISLQPPMTVSTFTCKRGLTRHRGVPIACNGAGGRVGFEINASRAGPLMRVVMALRW